MLQPRLGRGDSSLRAPAWQWDHAGYRLVRRNESVSRDVARAFRKRNVHMEEECGRKLRRYGYLFIAVPLLGVFVCQVATDITGKSEDTFLFDNCRYQRFDFYYSVLLKRVNILVNRFLMYKREVEK